MPYIQTKGVPLQVSSSTKYPGEVLLRLGNEADSHIYLSPDTAEVVANELRHAAKQARDNQPKEPQNG